MISFNNSDWLIPITQYYFYIIYIWAYNSGMQIEDLVPFRSTILNFKIYIILLFWLLFVLLVFNHF